MSPEVRIISHRGRGTGERPNSIASFERALSLGATGIETDIRITGDKKLVVSHDPYAILDSGKRIDIVTANLDEILKGDSPNGKPLTFDELFDYVNSRNNISFFLELKISSSELVKQLAERIRENNLWERVHLGGFSSLIKPALDVQTDYDRLRVVPFVNLPIAFFRHPKPSHGIFVGWLDDRRGSQTFFRTLLPTSRLKGVRQQFERNGFRVMAGVVNNEDGLSYFRNAGFHDIVTDEVARAKAIFNS